MPRAQRVPATLVRRVLSLSVVVGAGPNRLELNPHALATGKAPHVFNVWRSVVPMSPKGDWLESTATTKSPGMVLMHPSMQQHST